MENLKFSHYTINLLFSFNSVFFILTLYLLFKYLSNGCFSLVRYFYIFISKISKLIISVYFDLFNLNAFYKKYFIFRRIFPMKKFFSAITFFALISSQIFGFYGNGNGGRGFIDFLVDRDQLRVRGNHIGFVAGPQILESVLVLESILEA